MSRVEEIACLRLTGDRQTAARRVAALDELKPPPNVVLQVRAETVRLLLDAKRIPDALEWPNPKFPRCRVARLGLCRARGRRSRRGKQRQIPKSKPT